MDRSSTVFIRGCHSSQRDDVTYATCRSRVGWQRARSCVVIIQADLPRHRIHSSRVKPQRIFASVDIISKPSTQHRTLSIISVVSAFTLPPWVLLRLSSNSSAASPLQRRRMGFPRSSASNRSKKRDDPASVCIRWTTSKIKQKKHRHDTICPVLVLGSEHVTDFLE